MAKKSRKHRKAKKSPEFQFADDFPAQTPLDIEKIRLSSEDEEGVSISLKYFRQETECFSKWKPPELKKFSAVLNKISGQSAIQLKSYKPLCVKHRGPPAVARFARPDKLSEDLELYEIKVDPSNKARIHGVFIGSIFFMIWLDRDHAVFPE